MNDILKKGIARYKYRTGDTPTNIEAVLFDMDGVLYDSMPGHAIAWKKMCDSEGIEADVNEFFVYEGRTGASTINILYQRQFGHGADDETCRRLYEIKSRYFRDMGVPRIMPSAKDVVAVVSAKGLKCVLVTVSGQTSILKRLDQDYDNAFSLRITAHDVKHGKPHPEPYLLAMDKAGTVPCRSIAIDNAPLGVESASKAGAFTIGVRTGPIPAGALLTAGADIEVESMAACAKILSLML